MPPNWLLDIFAALMLSIAAVSAARLIVARLPTDWLSVAGPTGPGAWRRGPGGADNDIAHLLMGISMAGMLAASATTLPPRAWEAVFGVLTAWFAWRTARGTHMSGIRSLASGHSAAHLLHCAAMVYLFAAVTTSGSVQMTGMGNSTARSLEYPTLALAFAAVFGCYTVWDLGHLSGRLDGRVVASPSSGTSPTAGAAVLAATAPSGTSKFSTGAPFSGASEVTLRPRGLLLSPAAAVACRIAMSVTMAFMLLTMI